MTYKCRHCGRQFKHRFELGGHVTKNHRLQNSNYAMRKEIRGTRVRERAIHAMAKAIHLAMESGSLDKKTNKTFKWIKNRPIAAERDREDITRLALGEPHAEHKQSDNI